MSSRRPITSPSAWKGSPSSSTCSPSDRLYAGVARTSITLNGERSVVRETRDLSIEVARVDRLVGDDRRFAIGDRRDPLTIVVIEVIVGEEDDVSVVGNVVERLAPRVDVQHLLAGRDTDARVSEPFEVESLVFCRHAAALQCRTQKGRSDHEPEAPALPSVLPLTQIVSVS